MVFQRGTSLYITSANISVQYSNVTGYSLVTGFLLQGSLFSAYRLAHIHSNQHFITMHSQSFVYILHVLVFNEILFCWGKFAEVQL